METSAAKKIIGCIGKCTSGLTLKELDTITDSVHNTLALPQGRKIFREYLSRGKFTDYLICLDFYEKCCSIIEKEENNYLSTANPDLKIFTEDVNEAFDIAADLNGVPEIDLAILERFSECLTNPSRDSMLCIMKDTQIRLTQNLENIHKRFRAYALEPCPKTK